MKSQDLDACFDVMVSGPKGIDFQRSSIAKLEHLALLVNIPPQELISEYNIYIKEKISSRDISQLYKKIHERHNSERGSRQRTRN